MSQENVEIVRRFLEAIGPDSDLDALLDEFCDPEIEWHDVPIFPSAGVYSGDAFRRHAEEFEEAWADWGVRIEEIEDVADHVVARIRYYGVGKQSGAPITGGLQNPATGAVFDLRAGRILRVRQFVSHAEALDAVAPAMPRDNLEIVREHFADTNARRFEAALRAYDPNVELLISEDVAVDPGVYRGVDAVGEWFGNWFRTFASNYRMELVELVPVNDAVVATVDHRGAGRRSGVEVTTRYYNVYWIRENLIVRLVVFRERSEALNAAGRSQPGY